MILGGVVNFLGTIGHQIQGYHTNACFIDPLYTAKHPPVIRGSNPSRLDVPTQGIVDETRLARAVIAQHKYEGHLGRLIATGVELFERAVDIIVQRLDKVRMQLVTSVHYLRLDLPVQGG